MQISNAMVLETNYFKWIICRFLKWNNGYDSFPGIFHATTIMFKILDIVIFFTLLYPYQYNEWPGTTKSLETVVLQPESGGSIRRWDSSVAFSLSICTASSWLVLKSIGLSQDPKQYGLYLTCGGAYEPIQILDAIAPMNLITFVSCNCSRVCTIRQCYCKNSNVKCIAACGMCKNIDDETTDTNDD